jgi:hypothetical protein
VATNDGKQTNKRAEGWGSNTLPYCSAIWVLKIRRNWYKSLRRTQKQTKLVQWGFEKQSGLRLYILWAQTVTTVWAQTVTTDYSVGSDCDYSVGSDCDYSVGSDCTAWAQTVTEQSGKKTYTTMEYVSKRETAIRLI